MIPALLSLLLVASSFLSLSSAQSVSFTQVTGTGAFPPREYAACAQTRPTAGSTPTLYFYGGFNVTFNAAASTPGTNSYYDTYFNDAWSSTNFGTSWSQLTGSAAFQPQGWNGAVATSSGAIVYIGGGNDTNAVQNNQVWSSTDGTNFVALSNGPWDPRENAGIAGQAGTNNIIVALGNTKNDNNVDDIWLSTNAGQSWTQQCSGAACPFVTSAVPSSPAGQVHGPAAAGLSTGQWLLIGGYGSGAVGATSNTTWVTNQVAISTNNWQTFSTYTAPWSPRAQQRAVVDADNFVYVYGGVYDLPLSGSGTQYPLVSSQAYYQYFTDIYYSTNAASTSASWIQITQSGGLGSAGYPGVQFPGNPTTIANQAFFTQGADFNPCFGLGYTSSGAKQLILYTGLYAGYRQNNATNFQVAYPGVYVGVLSGLNGTSSGNGTVIPGASSSSTGTNGGNTGGNGAAAVQVGVAAVIATLAAAVAAIVT